MRHSLAMQSPTSYAIAWAIGLLLIGGLMTPRGDWYENLRKPVWQPPGWLFGPAWTIILGLAAWAGVRGWDAGNPAQQTDVLIVFAVNGCYIGLQYNSDTDGFHCLDQQLDQISIEAF